MSTSGRSLRGVKGVGPSTFAVTRPVPAHAGTGSAGGASSQGRRESRKLLLNTRCGSRLSRVDDAVPEPDEAMTPLSVHGPSTVYAHPFDHSGLAVAYPPV